MPGSGKESDRQQQRPLRCGRCQTDLRTAATPQATKNITAISPIRSQGTSRLGRTPIDTANANASCKLLRLNTERGGATPLLAAWNASSMSSGSW